MAIEDGASPLFSSSYIYMQEINLNKGLFGSNKFSARINVRCSYRMCCGVVAEAEYFGHHLYQFWITLKLLYGVWGNNTLLLDHVKT